MNTQGSSHKRIVIALIIPLIIVVLFVISNKKSTPDLREGIITINDRDYSSTADADDDGLLDWEEDLWGTDKNDPDSDGDGYKDGEEVRDNRNPLIPRPADILTELEKAEIYTSDSNFVSINKTDVVFESLLPGILLASNERVEGRDLSSEQYSSIATEALASVSESKILLYEESDLDVTFVTNNDEVSLYIISMLDAVLVGSEGLEDELVIVGLALENNSPDILKILTININYYKNVQKEMLALSVPKSMVGMHLDILNNLQVVVDSLQKMQLIFDDPFTGLQAIEAYRNHSAHNTELFRILGQEFQKIN